jgi:hypothetical protein
MTRILVYLNHLTLYYKRLGPQTEKYIPSLRLHLCCIKRITFTKQISLRPLIKIDKEKAKKISVELYEPFTLESWGIESIRVYFYC